MSKAIVLPLDGTHEGSRWIKISERDPKISEMTLSEGLFWTCDFTMNKPKPVMRLFSDNVWYLRNVIKKGWDPNFNFTHWLLQGFYVPKMTNEDVEEVLEYRSRRSVEFRNQLIYYI